MIWEKVAVVGKRKAALSLPQFPPFDFRFRAFSTSRTRLSQSLEQVTNKVEHSIPKTN